MQKVFEASLAVCVLAFVKRTDSVSEEHQGAIETINTGINRSFTIIYRSNVIGS